MKQYHLRLWLGLVIIALLVVSLTTSCTKSKSEGSPDDETDTVTSQQDTTPSPPGASGPVDATAANATQDAAMRTEAVIMAETGTAKAANVGQPTPTSPPQTTSVAPTQEPPTLAPTAQIVATIVPTTPPAIEPTTAPGIQPTAQPPASPATHEVKAGENLFRIALKHGLTYQKLAAYNNIVNPDLIYVGQILTIPGQAEQPLMAPSGNTHVVKAGENLFRIALQYNMPYPKLAEANNLSYPYVILPGQELIIP